MKKRFTEEQIIAVLKQGEAGIPVKEICRTHNISDGIDKLTPSNR